MYSNNTKAVFLTIGETAKALHVSKKIVNGFIDAGELIAKITPTERFVLASSVEDMLRNSSLNSGKDDDGLLNDNALYLKGNIEDDIYMDITDYIDFEDISVVINGTMFTGKVYTMKDGRFLAVIPKGKRSDGKRDREQVFFRDKNEANKYLADRLFELNGGNEEKTAVAPAAVNTVPNAPIQAVPSAMPFMAPYTMPPGMIPKDILIQYSAVYQIKECFADYAIKILNKGIGNGKSRTTDGYRAALVPVVKAIGKMKMYEIDKNVLTTLLKSLAKNYADSTLKKTMIALRAIFDEAYEDENFLKNPMDKIKRPKTLKRKPAERKPYSEDDIRTLFECARSYEANRMIYPMLAVYESCGLRPSELRSIMWKDIDYENKKLYIHQSVITVFEDITDMTKRGKSHEEIGDTKSDYSVRTVFLSDIAVEALQMWRKELNTGKAAMKKSKFVFPSQTGDFKSETSVKTMFQRFIKKYDLGYIGFIQYRFRHTLCTRLLTSGVSVPVVQRILGDNSPNVIMEVYFHLSKEKLIEDYSRYSSEQIDRYNEMYKSIDSPLY